jgi:Fic family protein
MKSSATPPAVLDVIPQQWAALLDAHERLGPLDPYLHWEELGRVPAPEGVSHEVWWAALKLARSSRMYSVALCDRQGRPFRFCVPDILLDQLHQLDRGRLAVEISSGVLPRFAASALVQESIASARLAGAAMPDEAAKEMLRTGRPPRDRGERMILDQYLALQQVRGLRNQALSPETVLDLHRCLTDGTLDKPDAAGRLRRDGEASAVVDAEGAVQHEPPPAGELARRMELMCAFANGQAPGHFIHPLIRAAILHFWLAHDRPFVDGNGRAARALFHWAMLRQDYSCFDLMSVSSVLWQAPTRYALSFRQTETDDNDLTYFILHQAEAVGIAKRALHERVVRKLEDKRNAGEKFRVFAELNARQQALVAHALRRPETRYVIAGHQRSHDVTHQTARDDLFDLVRRDLLSVSREKRVYVFRVLPELPRRLQTDAGRRHP